MPELRLIDANALHSKILEENRRNYAATENVAQILLRIETAPTIETGVRHGRWIDAHFVSGEDFFRCSECGCYIEKIYFANDYNVRYCPNCGAKMDGGADNG